MAHKLRASLQASWSELQQLRVSLTKTLSAQMSTWVHHGVAKFSDWSCPACKSMF